VVGPEDDNVFSPLVVEAVEQRPTWLSMKLIEAR